MLYYVTLENVTDENLAFLGYILIHQDDDFKIYLHFGDEIIVDRAEPFMWVDDLNDALLIGGEVISVPDDEE